MNELLYIRKLEEIMDYINDGIQIIDNKGNLIYSNKSAGELDAIDIRHSVGKHISEIYPSLNKENSTLLRVIATNSPILESQQTFKTYRGKEVTTINTTLPIAEDGAMIGAIEISRDITNYKKLSEKYVELKDEVSGKKDVKKLTSDIPKFYFSNIITHNEEFNRTKQIAMKAARKDIPVLVYGETGTGKELLVQSIHNASKRSNRAFVAQNCAALPTSLLEGILFGTAKGGFTGAVDRKGLFEIADGGTLFLDEINSMPLEVQAKLLRVLQDGIIRRVGDTITRKVDVRIIAAMNIDPNQAIKENQIRRDLYYRINTVTLWIPKLRDRREDILLLSEYFINKYNKRLDKDVKGISDKVYNMFMDYDWEGNVRELEHIIEGAVNFLDSGIITEKDLPIGIRSRYKPEIVEEEKIAKDTRKDVYEGEKLKPDYNKALGLKENLELMESKIIEDVLKVNDFNVSKTAKELKIPRQTLQYKIGKLNLDK